MNKILLSFLVTLLSFLSLHATPPLTLGAERMDVLLPLLQQKRVGLIVNHTSVVGSSGVHLLDTLISLGVDVTVVFAPEHGFRGDADAGETVRNGRDAKSGVPLISLYGSNKKPTPQQLSQLDILLFDIQDVGARFYTYISTMYYAMQACAEQRLPMVVLDRPNPNDYIAGAVLDTAYTSFVGVLPLPVLHGLTVAELALMINGEGWVGNTPLALTVIPMLGWQHAMPYDLPIKPSPNLPNAQSIALYPSLCLFEATKVSIGRGTLHPFQVIGYPDTTFGDYSFVPTSLAGFDKNPLQKGKRCYGDDLRESPLPATPFFTLDYFIDYYRKSGGGVAFFSSPRFFDLLMGNGTIRKQILAGESVEEIARSWQPDIDTYTAMRQQYLLYPDSRW